ncbi:hypothetical protein LPJ73_005503 [Coemansia sp. RSA 2703]|nr:hypothetical protein LPJ73_005503 [Coemansia sp. RSA 2703]
MAGNPDECSDFSGLYVTNERNLLCTPYSTPSIVNSDCSVPYGALYTEGQNGMIAIAGIFTLSSVEGTSLCSGGARMYTYMTAMWNLSPLATSILGYPVDVMRNYIAETQTGTNVYSQNSPTVIDMSGKTIITGDVYPKQSRNSNLQTTAQPEPPASVSTSQASNENSNDKSVSDNATKDEVNTNIISDTRSNAPSHTTSDVLSDFPSDALSDVLSNLGGDDNNEKASSFSNELSKEIAEITATGGTINEDTYKSILAELSQAGLNNNSSEQQQQQKSEGSDEKLSRTKIIVISVVVPIISLLIGFIAFLAYRAWISGKFKGHWDPQAEANHHRDAIFDLGGIYLDGTPPAYYRHSGSSSTLELNGNRAGRKSSDEKIEKD